MATLTDPKDIFMISEDQFTYEGTLDKRFIEPWVTKNLTPMDDQVRLVEMVGHFGCSQEYQRLVKRL